MTPVMSPWSVERWMMSITSLRMLALTVANSAIHELWTPSLHDACQPDLLWIVVNVGPKAEDAMAEMTIWASEDLWSHHVRFEQWKNQLKTCMIQLALKCLECGFLSLAFASWKIVSNCLWQWLGTLPLGIGKKAAGRTPSLWLCRAILEILPGEM